jgi:hypothetical protein
MARLTLRAALAAAVAVAPVAVAHADCAFDLQQLKVKVAREQDFDKKTALRLMIKKAEAARPTSETTCRNYVAIAWRRAREEAPTPPPEEVEAGAPNGLSAMPQPTVEVDRPNFEVQQPAIHENVQ